MTVLLARDCTSNVAKGLNYKFLVNDEEHIWVAGREGGLPTQTTNDYRYQIPSAGPHKLVGVEGCCEYE